MSPDEIAAQDRRIRRGKYHNSAFKVFLHYTIFEEDIGVGWAFSDKADYFLKRLWEAAGDGLEEHEVREPIGLSFLRPYQEGKYVVRMIRCPEPDWFAQNHFVALAWAKGARKLLPWKRTPERFRYLALESSVRMVGEDGPPSVLGEWTLDTHINYGDGPEPTEEAFRETIRPILEDKVQPHAVTNLREARA